MIAAVNIVYFRLAIVLLSLISSEEQTGYFATSFRVDRSARRDPWSGHRCRLPYPRTGTAG